MLNIYTKAKDSKGQRQ